MINYKTSGDFFVVETPKQGGGNIETTYPRQYFALKVGADMFQILNIDTKARLYLTNIADVTIDGVVFSNNDLFITELNKVLYSNSTATPTPTLATKTPMINENGVLVWQNTMSDGTITYTLQDGTAYAGDVTLLLPYTVSPNPIVTTLAINDTVDSGSSIPYLQIPFTGIFLGQAYTLTAVGLPTEIIQTLSITENDKINLNIENTTPNNITINTTITIIAIKQ